MNRSLHLTKTVALIACLLTQSLYAKTWDVMVYKVDERIFEPTLEAAKAKEPEKLAPVLEKLAGLNQKGDRAKEIYRETFTRSGKGLEPGPQSLFKRDLRKVEQIFKAAGNRGYFGPQIEWMLITQDESLIHYRVLDLSYLFDDLNYHQLKFEMYSSLRADWSLTAALRLQEGGIFVFEKAGRSLAAPDYVNSWFTACSTMQKQKQAAKQLQNWVKSPSPPSLLILSPENPGGNFLEFKTKRLREEAKGFIETASKIKVHQTDDRKGTVVDATLNPIINQKTMTFKTYEARAIAGWQGIPKTVQARQATVREGRFLKNGNGKIKSKPSEKDVFFRFDLVTSQ